MRLQTKWFINLSKQQKLRLTMMVITYGLVFYVVGVETNFFGSPMFSMFFIMNSNIVHGVVIYVALAAAAVLSAINLALILIQKRKVELPQIREKPFIHITKITNEASARVGMPNSTLKKAGKSENKEVEQKNQQLIRSVIKPTNQSTVQTVGETYIVKDATINQELGVKEKKGRFTCPACKKEFSTPLFTLEYAASTSKLIRHCPYCDHPLD